MYRLLYIPTNEFVKFNTTFHLTHTKGYRQKNFIIQSLATKYDLFCIEEGNRISNLAYIFKIFAKFRIYKLCKKYNLSKPEFEIIKCKG